MSALLGGGQQENKMAVAQENRIRKRMIEEGQQRCDIARQIEAAHMPRVPRLPPVPPPPAARRRDVRRWMQHNADDYNTATELAEAASAAFRLPDGGLDSETHWVWDEAAEAIDAT